MEVTIFEGTERIGSLTAEEDGLFWDFSCKINQDTERIRRIFVLSLFESHYLGIPDGSGSLTVKVPKKHLPNGIDGAVATAFPRGDWKPWRGMLDGVAVDTAYLRHGADTIALALLPEEAVKFPAWAREFKTENVHGVEMATFALDADGRLPLIKTESGGTENEKADIDRVDFELPADASADDSLGEQGWEADRSDL